MGNPPIILSSTPHGTALAPTAHHALPASPVALPLNYSATSSRATLNVVATSQSAANNAAPINFPLQLTSSKTVTSSSFALAAPAGQKISVQQNIMQKPLALTHARSTGSAGSSDGSTHHHLHQPRKQNEINPIAYSTILTAPTPISLSTTLSAPVTLPSIVSSTSSIVRSSGGLVSSIPLSIVQPRISLYTSQEQTPVSSASPVPTNVIQRTPPLSIKTIPPSSIGTASLPVVRALPFKSHPAGSLIATPLSPPGSATPINNNTKMGETLQHYHQHQHPQQHISILSSPPFPATPLTPATLRHTSPVSYTLPAASVTVKPSPLASHVTHASPRRGGSSAAREGSGVARGHHHYPHQQQQQPTTPHRETVCYGIPHQVYLVSSNLVQNYIIRFYINVSNVIVPSSEGTTYGLTIQSMGA